MEQASWLQLICDFAMLMVLSGGTKYTTIYIKWNKNMLHTICSCTPVYSDSLPQVWFDIREREHSLVISLDDVRSYQPVLSGYSSCVTLLSLTGAISVDLCSQALHCVSHLGSCRVNTAFCINKSQNIIWVSGIRIEVEHRFWRLFKEKWVSLADDEFLNIWFLMSCRLYKCNKRFQNRLFNVSDRSKTETH